jgi:response regulator RpfG family c-di-GMP phosphodiesterase
MRHEHPLLAERMLRPIEFLEEARRVVREHRERWDGGGFPSGIAGEAIGIGARVFAVAEIVEDALSRGGHEVGTGTAAARVALESRRGVALDPTVVDAFLAVPSTEWERLRRAAVGDDLLMEVA